MIYTKNEKSIKNSKKIHLSNEIYCKCTALDTARDNNNLECTKQNRKVLVLTSQISQCFFFINFLSMASKIDFIADGVKISS